MFISLARIIKFSLQDIGRNIWLSLVTIVILVLTLFSVNMLLAVRAISSTAVSTIKQKIDMSIYLKPDAPAERISFLQAKIAEAQAQLRKSIDEKIGKEKDKLKAEMDKTIAGLTKDLDGKKAEVENAIKQAKAQTEGAKGKGSEKKLENEGKKLLKKLKFFQFK